MKHLKTYESINEPQVGDYVVCEEPDTGYSEKVRNFVNNNVGQLFEIENETVYKIKYNNSPHLKNVEYQWYFYDKNNIKYSSPNKKDAEAYLAQKKYNI